MEAAADAAPAGERFPLVLLAQGNGQTIHDQAPLAEYLASHGYVAATTPSPMRVTGPLAGEEDIGRRAAEQAEDLAEARTALAGRPDVAALVSLDGGIGTSSLRESPRWVVEVPESHHHHFTSLGASTLTHPGLGNALRATARTAAAYRAVADATLEFLDAFVRKDGPAATRVRARAVHPPLGRPQALGAGCR